MENRGQQHGKETGNKRKRDNTNKQQSVERYGNWRTNEGDGK